MTVAHNRRIRARRGFALLISLMVSMIITVIGLTLALLAVKVFSVSNVIRESQYAYYASEAGTECAKYWSLKDKAYFTTNPLFSDIYCNGTTIDLMSGHSVDPSTGNNVFSFTFDYNPYYQARVRVENKSTDDRSIDIQSEGLSKMLAAGDQKLVQRVQQVNVEGLCAYKPDVMLVLDSSGSIDYTSANVLRNPINSPIVIDAAMTSIEALDFARTQAAMGIVTFSDYYNNANYKVPAYLVSGLISDTAALQNLIISKYRIYADNYTNVDHAFMLAQQELSGVSDRDDVTSPDFIIFVTDGRPIGYVDDSTGAVVETGESPAAFMASIFEAQKTIDDVKEDGTRIFVVGVNTQGIACEGYTQANGFPAGATGQCADWLRNEVASSPSTYFDATFNTLAQVLRNISDCAFLVGEK